MFVAAGKLQVYTRDRTPWIDSVAAAARLPIQCATLLRSLIDVWPDAVYTQPFVQTRLLGRPTFFVADPSLISTLLVDHAVALERDELALRALAPALGTGILTSDGAAWRMQRRTVASAFRPDCIRALVPRMQQAAQATIARWAAYDPLMPFDLLADMMRTALDIILAALVSGDDELDVDGFEGALETYISNTNWKLALALLGVPSWVPYPGRRAGAKAASYSRSCMADIVTRRKRSQRERGDLLGMLLKARDPETGAPMSKAAIVDNLLTFIAAGHETTALALTWTLRLLCDHPEVEQRVLNEIKMVGTNFDADPDAVDRLVYTRQVVMEAMRLFPPAPLIVRRTSKPVPLAGAVLPAGCSIHIPIYALHRQERLWPRPTAFEPDRFAPEQSALRERFAYMPFGAGPRVCIGAGLAMTECLVVLASLLPRFTIRPAHSTLPRTQMRITLRPEGGMPIFAEKRHATHG